MMKSKWIISLMLAMAVCSATAKSLQISQIIAKPIPSDYHFPTPATTIDEWIATNNTVAMRDHAWDIWSGMTLSSGEVFQGATLPIWETWYDSEDIFPTALPKNINALTAPAFLASHRTTLRTFIQPHQFIRNKSGPTLFQLFGPTSTRLLSFNKFSPDAAAFILAPHTGPGDQTYHYNVAESLTNLNNAWPTNTSLQDRGISNFPITSLEVKPVFSLVAAEGLTPLPVWQGAVASTRPELPTFNTWTTCVLVDPLGKSDVIRPATTQEIANANKVEKLSCKNYFYGSISMLYSFKLTATQADEFNKAHGNSSAKTNDFAVLVALHVNSHETPFWTWQTFYWQPPGFDSPNGFPGSKAGQPQSLKAPWTNYATCVNYSQTTTPDSRTMNICFNPYLEMGFPSAMKSNCMSCHGVARVAKNPDEVSFPLEYKEPIHFFTDPLYFNSTITNTEFSWAIADGGDAG